MQILLNIIQDSGNLAFKAQGHFVFQSWKYGTSVFFVFRFQSHFIFGKGFWPSIRQPLNMIFFPGCFTSSSKGWFSTVGGLATEQTELVQHCLLIFAWGGRQKFCTSHLDFQARSAYCHASQHATLLMSDSQKSSATLWFSSLKKIYMKKTCVPCFCFFVFF